MSARHVKGAHFLVDQVQLSQEANILAHWYVTYFARSGHRWNWMSKETIAICLRADKGIRGGRRRAGRRGPGTSVVRHHLTGQAVLYMLREIERAGIVEIVGGGRAVGKRYKGQRARGIRQHVRLTKPYHDALRGACRVERPVLEAAEVVEPPRCGVAGCERVPCLPQLHAESAPAGYEAKILEVLVGTTGEKEATARMCPPPAGESPPGTASD